jgi:CRISPR/Cas system CSM-associated protein Csm3 (group 7 of RAMP superfamily)
MMSDERIVPSLARLHNLELRLYRVETKSHLRIGAGEGAAELAAAELPLIRALVLEGNDEKRVPYLPGSSLHGVIRSWVEKALRSREEPLNADELHTKAPPDSRAFQEAAKEIKAFLGRQPEDEISEEEVYRHWEVYTHVCNPLLDVDKCERISGRETEGRRWKADFLEAIGRPAPCEVCSIFGYMGQRGRVKISHAFPATGDVPVDIITRVAINRLTGAADEGKLFDLEAIPPGCVFYFFAVLENMEPEQKRQFDMGVRALNLQLAGLGAHSTVGFGMVEVTRMFAVDIQPGIFEENVENTVSEILESGTYRLRENLDGSKYPKFFRALASIHKDTKQPPEAQFNNQIKFL